MKQQSLSQTNKFLLDPEKRRQALIRSVLSSSAVEGIKMTAQELTQLQDKALTSGSRSGSVR